jgi:hypothetical protein
LCFPLLGSAQTFYGSVVGTVTDKSAAVVPNAKVTLTNLGTNQARDVETDGAGNYRFVNLVPALYKVNVEAASFKHFVRSNIEVQVDSTFRVDAQLEIGSATETVEITAAAPLMQTESGSLGDTVEGKQVQEMPLNGRNTLNLIALVPGVVPQGNTNGSAAMNNNGSTSSAAWGNYQIGGGMPLQSSMYIDGAPLSIMNKNFTVLVPSQDMIQEFKVEAGGVSAEFGRFGGGVVNMTTKSGANKFHFEAYEYLRNNIVNANYFFTKRAGQARPQWTQNQFGVVASGPIWKDKAFFFFTWEAIHIRSGQPYTTNVPTANMQNGIFSNAITGLNGCKIDTTTNPGMYTIPSDCLDPSAQVFKTFYPAPNYTGSSQNYYTTLALSDDGSQTTGRIDYNMTSNQRVFGRFTLWPLVDGAPNYMGNANGWKTAGSQTHNHTNQLVVGDTITLNPTTVLDIRADYLRQYGDAIPPAFGNVDLSKFGSAYQAMSSNLSYINFPLMNFATGTQLHNLFTFTYNNLTRTYYNNYHLSASLTKIAGKHALKMGAEGRLIQRDDIGSDQNSAGTFNFSTTLAKDEWASFLMGYFDQAQITTIKATTTYNYYYGFYATDTWQATRKLTLNLGLRYELPGTPAEAQNNASVLLPNTVDPNTGIKGTVGLVNSSLYRGQGTLVPVHDAIGPRIGFAYRLNDNTVVRGGYALSYLPNDAQTGSWAANSPVNSVTTTNKVTAVTSSSAKLSNPFPATAQLVNGFAPALGKGDSLFMTRYIGQVVSGPDPNQPYPRSQSMNVSVGHQFRGDLMLDIGGTHTLGTHLAGISAGLDQLPDTYDICGTDKTQPQCNGHLLTDALSTPLVYDGVTLAKSLQNYAQTWRPYPAYNNYSNSTDYHGTSSYNALEVKFVKRLKATGQIGAAYTWMKLIGDTDTILTSQEGKSGGAGGNGEGLYQDYTNKKAERSIYSFSVPQRVVVNYVLNLPFGKGQRFAAGVHGVADKVVSGWSVDGITTFQSGYPLYLNISTNNLSKNYGAGTIRPNYIAGCAKTNSGSAFSKTLATATSDPTTKWFNTSCFASPGAYAFGNEPRVDGTLKSQGVDNFDFSAQKTTTIHENMTLKFRVEFFNLFNHTQFAPPVTQIDNSQAGLILQQANRPRLIQGALRLSF